MFKTLKRLFQQDRERFKIPKGVQDVIPIKTIWQDGVFRVGRRKYSKTYRFTDINYAVASMEDKQAMFLGYSEILNACDAGSTMKITIVSRKLNQADLERDILIPEREDELDKYRRELNVMLRKKAMKSSAIVQDKYITLSVYKRNIEDARAWFTRVGADLTAHFARMGSRCMEMNANERLRYLHSFYRVGEENAFHFDMNASMQKGHSFKDFICPDSLEFQSEHFRIGERYGRVLFLRDYANFIRDDMIAELCELNRSMTLSIDIIPIPMDEAVREVEKILLGVETNIANWQRRQNQNNNYSAVIPYDLEQQRLQAKEFLSDLTARDQRMMFAVVTIVHTADSKKQLDSDTDALLSTAAKYMCQIAPLKFQQMDGLNTALPIGVRKIDALRTLTTESLAVLMPFKVQEIMDCGGVYYGQNALSSNLILIDKQQLQNPNAFRLGIPGSGKSFGAKMEIVLLALCTQDDILVCDPEAEYGALIEALGGEVIRIAAGSRDHINAMDMVEGYGDGGDPVVDKSEFVLSLFELLCQNRLGPKEKSILDRCVMAVYEDYQKGGQLPTLRVLREKLQAQNEREAKSLALALELFTSGSMNAFAHETNVDVQNRMVSYNIKDLGGQMKKMGLLVITDAMINRVSENWKKGKRTHVYIDEFHVVFENEHSGIFFSSAWRRFRKRNAYPTGITQNVEYLLESVLASTMLSNSEFLVMHNQSPSDRDKLAKLLNISNEQMNYITNAPNGGGLLRAGSALVPFINEFPAETELYRLMSTKPNEKISVKE